MNVPDVSPDLPPRAWRVVLAAVRRLPQGVLSRSFGALADVPLPHALRPLVLGTFARAVGIDLEEAERPLTDYRTLNELFVRRLRPGSRSWPAEPTVIAAPVDGTLGQTGRIEGGRLIQAKGRGYSASDLLGDAAEAERFEGGSFVTMYLSPRDYHRIHSPATGAIPLARHLPGGLLPVNAAAVTHVDALFARNERLVCQIETPDGWGIAVVAVGAYNVGRISAAFDPAWGGGGSVTNRRVPGPRDRRYDPPVHVGRGEEIMAFHLGSTVVLLLDPHVPPLRDEVRAGEPVRLGAALTRAGRSPAPPGQPPVSRS